MYRIFMLLPSGPDKIPRLFLEINSRNHADCTKLSHQVGKMLIYVFKTVGYEFLREFGYKLETKKYVQNRC